VVTRQVPETGQIVFRRTIRQLVRQSFADAKPQDIAYAVNSLLQGIFRPWSDICDVVVRDPVVRRAYATRRNSIASRKTDIKPSPIDPRDIAMRAVDMTRDLIDRQQGFEFTLMRQLDGLGKSAAVHEIVWSRDRGLWLPSFEPVLTRDLEWDTMGGLGIRPLNGDYIRIADHPGKFWSFIPSTQPGLATDQGDFISVLYWWVFKKWGVKFWLQGAERFGNPFIYARMAENSPETARASMLNDLQNMSADSVGVVAGDGEVIISDAKAAGSSDVWTNLVNFCDKQIQIALVGSPDLFDAGKNGSYDAVETRDNIRLESSRAESRQLWSSFQRDVLGPFFAYNADLFGGVAPSAPTIETVFDKTVRVEALPMAVSSGVAITQNEYRTALGLDQKDDPSGDEIVVAPAQPSYGGFSNVSGGDAPDLPLAWNQEKMVPGPPSKPMRQFASSVTSSVFLNQLKRALEK